MDLLGRQVIGRADDLASPRIFVGFVHEPRKPQIRHFGNSLGSDQNVARLDIAMDQTALMSVFEPARRLNDDVGRLLHRQGTLTAYKLAQVRPRDVLGHQIMDIAVMPRVVSANKMRVVQLRLRADLAAEVVDRLGRRLVQRQHLDRAFAAHDRVNRLENLAHAALSDPIGNRVRTKTQLGAAGLELIRLVVRDHPHFDESSR